MTGQIPNKPKIYHIVHIDNISSIINTGYLLSDKMVQNNKLSAVAIGMKNIKSNRLSKNLLSSYSNLYVGDCVPFYFCPRSIMLYMLHKDNHPEITYHGGQAPIVHLQADLYESVNWAKQNNKNWVFTSSNAGSYYFEDFNDLNQLDQINWNAVNAMNWQDCKEEKQAEFLLEEKFPWSLIEKIGVYSQNQYQQVKFKLNTATHQPEIKIEQDWYYQRGL